MPLIMTDEDILLVVSILSNTTDKFWVVYEHNEKFMVIGGPPWALYNSLNNCIHPFSWRDQFNTPKMDEY
tara:strand:- start:291 stop:500 length:210 start_codon:yes stop_codon:yes gene_type:complete